MPEPHGNPGDQESRTVGGPVVIPVLVWSVISMKSMIRYLYPYALSELSEHPYDQEAYRRARERAHMGIKKRNHRYHRFHRFRLSFASAVAAVIRSADREFLAGVDGLPFSVYDPLAVLGAGVRTGV